LCVFLLRLPENCPFPQIDIIGGMVIILRVRGKNIRSVYAVLCATIATIVHSAMHTHEQT